MAVPTVEYIESTETTHEIEFVSISRKKDDCFKITISSTVYYVENWVRHADIYPIPLDSIVRWSTDPETLYTKNWVSEHIWGESIHDTIYTNQIAAIQNDIDGYMKERYLESASAGPINTLNNDIYFDPDWTP